MVAAARGGAALKRLAICALPIVAAAAVLAVVIGSEGGRPKPSPVTASAGTVASRMQAGGAAVATRSGAAEIRGAAARRMPIPILMYHVVGTPRPGAPNLGLWVTPPEFASQMDRLSRAGYRAITLAQAWRGWTAGGPLPRKPLVVSFDDGYAGDYTHALPTLRKLDWPGVLNLELRNVGPRNLSARQVNGLIAAGWEIDSHTIDHPDLTTVGPARMDHELRGSREAILRRFGVDPRFFCYPYGRFDSRVEAAVKAAGYLAATTEIEGYARPGAEPFALPRIRVQYGETAPALLAHLRSERPLQLKLP